MSYRDAGDGDGGDGGDVVGRVGGAGVVVGVDFVDGGYVRVD